MMRSKRLWTLLLVMLMGALATGQDDPLIRAMRDELARSMRDLKLPDAPKPYFIAYRVDQIEQNKVGATLGSLLDVQPTKMRLIGVELRVGDASLDNTNFLSLNALGMGGGRFAGATRSAPLDDDYAETRRQLWRATDEEYKRAVEDYSAKRAVIANRKESEPVPDFSAEPAAKWTEAYAPGKQDLAAVQQLVRELSAGFRQFPELEASSVELTFHSAYTRYLNSEGTTFTRWRPEIKLSIKAETQASDGMPLGDSYEIYAGSIEELPARPELLRRVESMGQRLRRLREAGKIENYNGPVLFEDTAAGEVFAKIFAPALVAARQPLTDNPRFAMFFERFSGQGGNLLDRIGGRVLPASFSLVNDPQLATFDGVKLPSALSIDDDGVPAQKVTLVENGVLKTLLMTRTPVRGIRKSTGSRRGWGPAPVNLVLSAGQGKAAPALRQELLRLAKQRGSDYGIVVRSVGRGKLSDSFMEAAVRMAGREATGSDSLLEVYKLYGDGREELVRGAQIDGLTVASFREIVSAGDRPVRYTGEFMPRIGANFLSGLSSAAAGGMPVVSYIVPSLLFEELNLKPATGPFPALPASVPPLMAADHR